MDLYESVARDLEFVVLKGVDNIEYEGETIPRPHQEFPDRLLQSHPDKVDFLGLDYAVGTGKSLTAVIPLVRIIMQGRELNRISTKSGDTYLIPRPYVVGTWATINAFETELLKPIFELITPEQYDHMMSLGQGDEYWNARRKLLSIIHKEVQLMTYQKFFNYFFRGSINLPDKSDAAIVQAILDGKIYLNTDVIGELNESIIIIDEMQNLYSQAGANTYGTCFEFIHQSEEIENLVMLGLSGTFLNSTIAEFIFLANIARPKGMPRFDVDKYIERVLITSNQYVIKVRANKKEELLKFSEGRFATYVAPTTKEFPKEIPVGELIKTNRIKFEKLLLIRCYSSSLQWEKYQDVRDKELELDLGDTEELDDEPLYGELYIPPKDEWHKHDIREIPGLPGNITGDFLKLENLHKFGAIPARFIEMVLDNLKSGKREKMVAYHRRIRRMGIFQYAEILKMNGFITMDDAPRDNTLCVVCGMPKKTHKRNTKHEYIPARFVTLIGDFSDQMRRKILRFYNSPANVYIEKAAIMLMSGIAELGITIKDVMHAYYLGSIPNLAKYRQLNGRFARYMSHENSPPYRRVVKTYVLVYSAPPILAKKGELSSGELLYYIKETNDNQIVPFWNELRTRSINCHLNPSNGCKYVYKTPKTPSTEKYKILYAQLETETIRAVVKHMLLKVSPVWMVRDVREAIKQNKYQRYPWAVNFIGDISISNAIWEMENQGDVSILSLSGKSSVEVNPTTIKGDDLVITRRQSKQKQSLAFNLFTNIVPSFTLAYMPLVEGGDETELKQIFARFNTIKGFKNQIDAVDAMVIYDDFLPLLQKDFFDKGPFYGLLKRIGAIIYEGDDVSHIKFAQNRLAEKEKELKVLGFIFGVFFFKMPSSKNDKWDKIQLPKIDLPHDIEEWDYVGIYSTGTNIAPGKWKPRFKVRPRLRKLSDQRAQRLGMGCRSIERDILIEIYKKIVPGNVPSQKEEMCENIRMALTKRQITSKVRTIYTMFEIPKSHL